MKRTLVGLLALMTLAATGAMAEPLYTAQVQITTDDQLITSFTLMDTMYGVSEATCVARLHDWTDITGAAFVEGTDAQVAAICAPMGAFSIAAVDM